MNFLRYYIYYIILHLTLTGSGLVQVGDAVNVNLDSSISYKYSDNIVKVKSNAAGASVFTFTPGAVISFGQPGSMLDAKLTVKYDIIDNKDYDNLDINLLRYTLNDL